MIDRFAYQPCCLFMDSWGIGVLVHDGTALLGRMLSARRAVK